jgi:poly(A) polymerase
MDDLPLRTKPPCDRADAEMILRRLRDAGHVAYFAGGCVRDLLLGLAPKDYDIATDAPPQRVRELFSQTQAVGAAFGVILVHCGRSVVEVATFRSEGPYLDGRRPSQVAFTTAEKDAQRRDFTINGLFLDPLDNDHVIDFVGGREDLLAHRLRAIGRPADRFAEDHLRLLRAIRFAARFNLDIEPATASAIAEHAPLLKGISPERIADELRLILTAPTRAIAWPMLWRFKLIHVILRFLPLPAHAELHPDRSISLAVAPGAEISFGLALASAALCSQCQPPAHDIRPLLEAGRIHATILAIDKALRLSNQEFDEIRHSLEGITPLLADELPRLAAIKRFLARTTAPQSRKLMDAIAHVGLHVGRIDALRCRLVELEETDYAPPPFISGDDLTLAGLTPGPSFRTILDAVYDAQLEGRVRDREAAMQMALSAKPSQDEPPA